MKAFKLVSRYCAVSLLFVLFSTAGYAQCSMCRAVTGSSQFSEDTFTPGRGLNNAILYLMAMPYVMALLFVLVFFRKQIKGWFTGTQNATPQ
jgi:hypothetical protein